MYPALLGLAVWLPSETGVSSSRYAELLKVEWAVVRKLQSHSIQCELQHVIRLLKDRNCSSFNAGL